MGTISHVPNLFSFALDTSSGLNRVATTPVAELALEDGAVLAGHMIAADVAPGWYYVVGFLLRPEICTG